MAHDDVSLMRYGFIKDESGLLEVLWMTDDGHMHMKLMKTDTGYWVILEKNSSGHRTYMNIGHLTSIKNILDLRDQLIKTQ